MSRTKRMADPIFLLLGLTLAAGVVLCNPQSSSVWGQGTTFSTASTSIPGWAEIQSLIANSIHTPRMISQTELSRDRQQVLTSLQRLEQRLLNERYREQWRSFLKLDLLKAAVQPDTAFDDAQWEEFDSLLQKAQFTWWDPTILSLQQSARRCSRTLRVFSDPDYRNIRTQKLSQLLEEIKSYSNVPDEETRQSIGKCVGWLTLRDDAANVVKALNTRFLHPNVSLSLSAELFRRELNRPLKETFPINDVYVGTYVYGNGSLEGNLTTRLTNTNGKGSLTVDLSAQILAYTSGGSNGVSVSTSGNTTVSGTKTILFDEFAVLTLPAVANAQSTVQINGINAPGGRYGQEARRQVYGSRWQAEQQARASAEQLARTRMDEFATSYATRLNNQIRQEVLSPLAAKNMLPRSMTSRSSSDQLHLSGVLGDWSEWGAPEAPPTSSSTADATLMIHRSAIENLTESKLRGRSLNEQEFLQQLNFEDVKPPVVAEEEIELDEPEFRTILSFDTDNPIEVQLDGNQMVITLRLTSIESGGTTYPGVEMTLTYAVQINDHVATLVRDSEPQVLPSRFDTGEGKRLSGPQQILRKTLIRRLVKSIPEVTPLERLIGDHLEVAEMKMKSIGTDQGWLQIELENPPQSAAVK